MEGGDRVLLEVIKRKCEERGITTYKLALECGLTGGAVDKWDESMPSVKSLKAVADYFGTTMDELMREAGG